MTPEQLQQFKTFMDTIIGKESHNHHYHIIKELFDWHNILFPNQKEKLSSSSCGGCRARVYKKVKQQYDGLFPKQEAVETKNDSLLQKGIDIIKSVFTEATPDSSSETNPNTKDTPYINLLKENGKVKK